MSNAVIITAKTNNLSIKGKNKILISGKPCIYYPIMAGINAKMVDKTFVFSDGEDLRNLGQKYGAIGIEEPEDLTLPNVNHGDAIAYAIDLVRSRHLLDLDIVTILLGNSVYVDPEIIDLTYKILNVNSKIDSVMTVWQAQDDHPYRALQMGKNGYLESFLGTTHGTNRQEYPPVYYYDQGPWTFRIKNILNRKGPAPWWWMGKNSFPIVRNWVTGRDVHTQLDVSYSKYWIDNNHEHEILNMKDINNIIN